MATRNAVVARPLVIFFTLLCVLYFVEIAEGQHGGGGSHSGGGHSGGHSSSGHSSSRHSGESKGRGHFGWLHFGWHSGRHRGVGASTSLETPSHHVPSELWNLGAASRTRSIPTTLVWSPQLFPAHGGSRVSFGFFPGRHHRAIFHRFPRFSSSGCFFNGMTQVCFFEPFFPLLSCYGDFGFFDFTFGGGPVDSGDGIDSQGHAQPEMSVIAADNPPDEEAAEGPLPPGTAGTSATDVQDSGKRVFLLVLHNGARRAVTDYWMADGYLEYISPDGTRSHIPIDALDLQNTVIENAPRGLAFVLRAAPAANR
jgi:hypothetical protein